MVSDKVKGVLTRHTIENGMVNFWLNTDPPGCVPAISLPVNLILQIAKEIKQ